MTPNRQQESDRLLREKMDAFRPGVPAHLWEEIQSKLDHGSGRSPAADKAGPNRKRSIYRWSIAASILLAMGAWFMQPNNQQVIHLRGEMNAPEAIGRPEKVLPDAEYGPVLLTAVGSGEQQVLKQGSGHPGETEELTGETGPAWTHQPPEEPAPQSAATSVDASGTAFVTQSNGNRRLDIDPAFLKTEGLVSIVPDRLVPPVPEPQVSLITSEQEDFAETGEGTFSPVPRLLNLAIAQLDKRPEKFLSFSSDGEGNLRISINR